MEIHQGYIQDLKILKELTDSIQNTSSAEQLQIIINNIYMHLVQLVMNIVHFKSKGLSPIDKRCIDYIVEMRSHRRPISIELLENTSKGSSVLLEVVLALDSKVDKDFSDILLLSLSINNNL